MLNEMNSAQFQDSADDEREKKEHSLTRLRNIIFWTLLSLLCVACVTVAALGGTF